MTTELVIFEGADEATRQLCEEYWLVGPKRRFVFSISELAARHDTFKEAILQRVRASCVLFEREASCVACGAPNGCRNRAEFQQRRAIDRAWVCISCLSERPGQAHVPGSHDAACVNFLRAELLAKRRAGRAVETLAPSVAVYLAALLRGSR